MKRAFALMLLLFPMMLMGQGRQVVAVDGVSVAGTPTPWSSIVIGNPFINVTTTNPRFGFGDVGSGSLEMRLNGMNEYAFWRQDAAFGNLAALSRLSFDWFRLPVGAWDAPVGSIDPSALQPIPSVDWYYKTPVLRLHLRERRAGASDVISELVWEGYFNNTSPTPVNTWVTQNDMHQGNFWYVSSLGYDLGTCSDPMTVWQGGIRAMDINDMFRTGCLQNATVDITGISIGIGSQWPLEYAGFVDNVQMEVGGDVVLDANFDAVVVPEPSTWTLMLTGLLVVAGISYRRRART